MATIKDVAGLAGVSIGTVSNFINNSRPVSRETAEKVQNAIEVLNYTPNMSARNLKANITSDIGLIIPSFNDTYYVQVFQGIECAFQNSEYSVHLSFSNDIPDLEEKIAREYVERRVSGLILVSCLPDQWRFYYNNFTSRGIPIVLIDRDIRGLDTSLVTFDNHSILYHMSNALLAKGKQNLVLISGPEKFDCEARCINGFKEAHSKMEVPLTKDAVVNCNMSKEEAFRRTLQIFRSNKPDAIISTSESITRGIIEAIRLLGFSTDTIPVLSLGEEHWNLYSHTIANVSASRPAMKLGNAAAEILMDQLESPLAKETEKMIVPIAVNTNSQPKIIFSQPIEHSLSEPQRLIKILMMDTPQVHALSNMAQNFENRTGVKTQIDILPHNQIYDKIISSHQSSEPRYDVIMYDIPWLPMLASQGVLSDISDTVSSLDETIFIPGLLDHFSHFENSHYGVPFMYAPQIFYYRLDLFEDPVLKAEYEKLYSLSLRPPVTLKEYNNLANFFTRQTTVIGHGLSVSAAYDECLAPEIYMRIQAYNGGVFDRQGNVVIDSPQSLKAYIHLMRSIKLAKPDFRQATDTSIVQDFIQGDTAMLITYPSFLTDLVDLRRSSMIGSIGYSLIPGRKPLLGGWGLGLTKHSKHKEDAFAFLEWSCSEQIANYMTVLGGNTAITSTYENDELTTLYPWLPLYLETYQYTSMTIPSDQGKIMNQNEVDAIVCKWLYKLMDQELDVVTALKNTQIELEELTNSTFV